MKDAVNWVGVCQEEDIIPDTGICVYFNDEQVAIFKESINNELFAISNFDPNSSANVLSRGIVGSIGERLVVASPIYKQHFCLKTGECLETGTVIKTYAIRVHQGEVQLSAWINDFFLFSKPLGRPEFVKWR